MSKAIKISLSQELWSFVQENSGDGTPFGSPSEFVLKLLHEKKLETEAALMGEAILEGYRDILEGRTVRFQGDLRRLLNEFPQ